MNHDLKIDDVYLKQKLDGDKLFEIRYNDRGYQKGDTVTYTECKFLEKPAYHVFLITYVTSYQQQPDYVVFGERHLHSTEKDYESD